MGKYKRQLSDYTVSAIDIYDQLIFYSPYLCYYNSYLKDASFYSIEYIFFKIYHAVSKCIVPKRGGQRLPKKELEYLMYSEFAEDIDDIDRCFRSNIEKVNKLNPLKKKIPLKDFDKIQEKIKEICFWIAERHFLRGTISKEELKEELEKVFNIPPIDINHEPSLYEEAKRYNEAVEKLKAEDKVN